MRIISSALCLQVASSSYKATGSNISKVCIKLEPSYNLFVGPHLFIHIVEQICFLCSERLKNEPIESNKKQLVEGLRQADNPRACKLNN